MRQHIIDRLELAEDDRDFLTDKAFEEDRMVMYFSENLCTEDTFFISRISDEEKYAALFIKSSYAILLEVVDIFLNKTHITMPSNLLLSKLELLLIQISKFVFGFEHHGIFMT